MTPTESDLRLAGDRALILAWMREHPGESSTTRVAIAVGL